jgi:hypothetical protein
MTERREPRERPDRPANRNPNHRRTTTEPDNGHQPLPLDPSIWATQRWPDHGWRRDRFAYERGRLQLASVEITAHGVAVEACALELAHNHADVLLAEVLSPVPRNRDHNAGFVAEAPMARCLAAEFGKAVID